MLRACWPDHNVVTGDGILVNGSIRKLLGTSVWRPLRDSPRRHCQTKQTSKSWARQHWRRRYKRISKTMVKYDWGDTCWPPNTYMHTKANTHEYRPRHTTKGIFNQKGKMTNKRIAYKSWIRWMESWLTLPVGQAEAVEDSIVLLFNGSNCRI